MLNLEFRGKYIITGKIICETGLHIGGATEGFEIGGVEKPVIKDPLTEQPYIPGSSLKGKLRHLLEWTLGKVEKHPKQEGYTAHFCGECDACVIFGPSSDETEIRMKAGPTRLTVRDAFPTDETIKDWEELMGERTYTELKWENTINRVTSEANPRPMERVPKGSEFRFEMLLDVYKEEDKDLLKSLFTAMQLLENSALGGSGTRGHGQVRFEVSNIEFRSTDFYKTGKDEKKKPINLPTTKVKGDGTKVTEVKDLLDKFSEIDWGDLKNGYIRSLSAA